MNPSWKTSLCGVLGALFLGLSQIPELSALWIKIFMLLGGLMPSFGLLFARDNKVTSEQALHTEPPGPPRLNLNLMLWLICPALLLGCVAVKPGNDPLVVQTERALTVSEATFRLCLQVDHSDRGFWKAKAPAFHEFCEDLRTPTVYQVTNTLPRYRVALLSVADVKRDYQTAKTSSNALFTALATLQSFQTQAGAWLTIVTNR